MTNQQVYNLIASVSENESLTRLEKQMIAEIVKSINESTITTGGRVTGLTQSAGAIITKGLRSFYGSNAYKNSIASILKNINIASDAKVSVYKDEGLEISKSAITKGQSLVIDEYIDNLSDNGLNARFNQPLRALIYENIRNGVSLSGLVESITEKIGTTDVKKYVNSVARNAADAYSAIVDKEIYSKYKDKITHYRVLGTLIETSSPQCRRAVEFYDREIPIEELPKLIKFAKEHGGSDELNADNLPVLKLHYGCRHQFLPIIK